MKKKKSRNSIDTIQEELQKYNVSMSEEMKQDLEAPGRKRSSHTLCSCRVPRLSFQSCHVYRHKRL